MGSKDYFDRVADRWDEMRFFPEKVRDSAYMAAGIQSGKRAAGISAPARDSLPRG